MFQAGEPFADARRSAFERFAQALRTHEREEAKEAMDQRAAANGAFRTENKAAKP